jgi:hypothetical protein
MQRQTIHTGQIRSVGYDPMAAILEIEFANGDVYDYFNVPSGVFEHLMVTPLKEEFVRAYVQNSFPVRKVNTGPVSFLGPDDQAVKRPAQFYAKPEVFKCKGSF